MSLPDQKNSKPLIERAAIISELAALLLQIIRLEQCVGTQTLEQQKFLAWLNACAAYWLSYLWTNGLALPTAQELKSNMPKGDQSELLVGASEAANSPTLKKTIDQAGLCNELKHIEGKLQCLQEDGAQNLLSYSPATFPEKPGAQFGWLKSTPLTNELIVKNLKDQRLPHMLALIDKKIARIQRDVSYLGFVFDKQIGLLKITALEELKASLTALQKPNVTTLKTALTTWDSSYNTLINQQRCRFDSYKTNETGTASLYKICAM